MHYQFPVIQHLNDVLPAIEGRDEFVVATREWGVVVNYLVVMADTFPPIDESPELEQDLIAQRNAIRRECRGLLFYPDGRIMSRRLHKFFNVNERDETADRFVDLNKPHVILEKLDGSMITPVVTSGGLRWGTKMGITDVSMQAELFVAKNPDYIEFSQFCIDAGHTPIYEWCSRSQRIVVDYPDDRLVLIAIRNTITGKYTDYAGLKNLVGPWKIELVKTYPGTAASMEHLIAETRAVEDIEGWIIRFDNGQMVKIKGDWYVRIHKVKDALAHEKNVVEMLINEAADDVKPHMLEQDRVRLEQYETDFWIGIAKTVQAYEEYFAAMQSINMDRKTWATQYMPAVKAQNPFTAAVVFGQFDGKDVRKMVLDIIAKNLGTQTKVDSVRLLWGEANWKYQHQVDQ
jgi:RNA ligase